MFSGTNTPHSGWWCRRCYRRPTVARDRFVVDGAVSEVAGKRRSHTKNTYRSHASGTTQVAYRRSVAGNLGTSREANIYDAERNVA